MSQTVFYWDYAWKEFLNPEAPWFEWFITSLLGEEFVGYELKLDKSEVTSLNTEQRSHGEVRAADSFLLFSVDEEKRILHLEFESTWGRDTAKRMLRYGLDRVGVSQCDNVETVELPMAFIVYVKPTGKEQYAFRRLRLKLFGQEVELNYPVVYGYKAVSHIEEIMYETDESKMLQEIDTLVSTVISVDDDESWDDRLRWACAVLNIESRANRPATEKEVAAMMYRPKGRKSMAETWVEQGIEEGREQDVAALMKNTGWSEAQAREMLGHKTDYQSKRPGGLNKMQL